MARTVAVIQQQIIDAKNAEADLAGLTSDSHRAIWYLWTFVIATCVAFLEQLMDLYLAAIELLVGKSPGASALWVQDKLFKFQYDATVPQIAVLVDLAPQYPIEDATKRIITACSVNTDVNNTVQIKVAKDNPFVALSSPELAAAQSYINTIGVAGISYNLTSLNADRIYIAADIYYQGQYAAVIEASVVDTLDAYFQNLSVVNFNGALKMSDLAEVIRNVTGVNDVVVNAVIGRPETPYSGTPITNPNSTILIQGATLLQRLYTPTAGYVIQEDEVGYTFADSLTFIPQ